MAKILMVEYQGRCDEDLKAVGHAPKVLKEYFGFAAPSNEISIAAPGVILNELPQDMLKNAKTLPHHIVMKGRSSLREKIANKFNMFKNIKAAINGSDADILWFFNVEFYLMLYIALHGRPKQNTVCNLFYDGFHGSLVQDIKQWIFERAQKKLDHIVSTGRQLRFRYCPYTFIPDYYYRHDLYDDYRNREKEDKAVCLGTMNSSKELEEMVAAFSRINYPLDVIGRFYDKQRLLRIRDMAGENISISDSYISDEEYLDILSKARYSVLPYPASRYSVQTSGVLQESMFLDTIPVSYGKVLEANGIDGIGFDSWDDLTAKMLRNDNKNITGSYEALRTGDHDQDVIKSRYKSLFESLMSC